MLELLLWVGVILIGGVVGPLLALIAAGLSTLVVAGVLLGEVIKDLAPPSYLVEGFVVSLWVAVAAAVSLFAQLRLFAQYFYGEATAKWTWYGPAWLVGAVFTGIMLTVGQQIGLFRWVRAYLI